MLTTEEMILNFWVQTLNFKKYSTASDVWSFGALMFEIWSLGHKPFESKTNHEVNWIKM